MGNAKASIIAKVLDVRLEIVPSFLLQIPNGSVWSRQESTMGKSHCRYIGDYTHIVFSFI